MPPQTFVLCFWISIPIWLSHRIGNMFLWCLSCILSFRRIKQNFEAFCTSDFLSWITVPNTPTNPRIRSTRTSEHFIKLADILIFTIVVVQVKIIERFDWLGAQLQGKMLNQESGKKFAFRVVNYVWVFYSYWVIMSCIRDSHQHFWQGVKHLYGKWNRTRTAKWMLLKDPPVGEELVMVIK